jgi:hypothetical protein
MVIDVFVTLFNRPHGVPEAVSTSDSFQDPRALPGRLGAVVGNARRGLFKASHAHTAGYLRTLPARVSLGDIATGRHT